MSLPDTLKGKLNLPVLCSPMFIISTPKMVIEQCKAGVVGSFPALNARPAEKLDEWLTEIDEALAAYQADNPGVKVAPYAVNQIAHPTNDRLEHDMQVCVKHKVPIIITSLQANPMVIEAAHSYGGLVFHDVTNIRHAKKALSMGVDGLILVTAGAGGHAGTLSPFALLSEIRQFFDGPVILGGAITKGNHILGAQVMGADMAYMGTRFIATEEANAEQSYKDMIVESSASDIVYTNLFTGVHGNYLRGSIEKAGLDPDNLPLSDKSKMSFGSGGSSKSKAWRDIWGAGQGVGGITQQKSVADTVAELRDEYETARQQVAGSL
ncbi:MULTISPECIES: NAD(P)H-dependent flavin oxidoreductase [Marinobacter]|uniref:Nitronate monooxygenase n=1 Tax=Marinobacter profundi TaxID=2666256 RepID=A0A2G1UJ53_9GAMM|nr:MULTISPECIES: nitronate monooxygenase family protein [Marinobacter]MBD3656995.1 nitronate monooxygenase [Marinobacter sp.]PHQ14507.1 nitronate monooxygenase [Marinobacter profundi]